MIKSSQFTLAVIAIGIGACTTTHPYEGEKPWSGVAVDDNMAVQIAAAHTPASPMEGGHGEHAVQVIDGYRNYVKPVFEVPSGSPSVIAPGAPPQQRVPSTQGVQLSGGTPK